MLSVSSFHSSFKHTKTNTFLLKKRIIKIFPPLLACKVFSKVSWIWKVSLSVCLNLIAFWDIYTYVHQYFSLKCYNLDLHFAIIVSLPSFYPKKRKNKSSQNKSWIDALCGVFVYVYVCTCLGTSAESFYLWCYRFRLHEVSFNIWTITATITNSQTLPLYKCLGKYALYYLYVNINTDSLGILLIFCSGSLLQLTNQEVLKCNKG